VEVKISRWGNSLAVRLPKELAERLALSEGQTVDVESKDGALELRPKRQSRYPKYDRDALIDAIDPNEPEENFDDGPVGREII
jgi:antitoxin MazE